MQGFNEGSSGKFTFSFLLTYIVNAVIRKIFVVKYFRGAGQPQK